MLPLTTFPIKNEAVVDQACRDFATTFILIANPDPSEVKKLPVMPPVVAPFTRP